MKKCRVRKESIQLCTAYFCFLTVYTTAKREKGPSLQLEWECVEVGEIFFRDENKVGTLQVLVQEWLCFMVPSTPYTAFLEDCLIICYPIVQAQMTHQFVVKIRQSKLSHCYRSLYRLSLLNNHNWDWHFSFEPLISSSQSQLISSALNSGGFQTVKAAPFKELSKHAVKAGKLLGNQTTPQEDLFLSRAANTQGETYLIYLYLNLM